MKKFKDWFENNLTVGAFPYRQNPKFEASEYDIVINVSDEWYIDTEMQLRESFINTYWFPMNEAKKDIGLNSIYGAMVILQFAEQRNLRVYLHCHAGVNRSEIARAAYYFMRTNKQIETQSGTYINKLIAACSCGYLPPKAEMESFLGKVASLTKRMSGGILDMSKIDTINNF
jgi:hypothetical protein